jgi:hypothetical protein
MRRNAIVTFVVVIAVLALGAQLAIPAYVSSRVEDRLTEQGGSAHVEIHATPATKLLGGGGDRVMVRGRDLRFDLPRQNDDVFGRLDEFGEVDAELTQVRTGPFAIERFTLKRDGDGEPYRLSLDATSTADELSEYAGSQVGGPLGGLISRLTTGLLLPLSDRSIPVSIDADVRSENGRARVVSASGDIAGIPAGPIAEAIAGAVAGAL